MFLVFSHAPGLKGIDAVPACRKFLGTLYIRAHGTIDSNQILHVNQTILEENFYTPPALVKNILTGMLTRNLFAVANFI